MKAQIYAFVRDKDIDGDVYVVAIGEDGTALAGHLSSSPSWARHDIGVTSTWKHEHYAKSYPDGFEVIWIEDPKTDPRAAAAYAKHAAKYDGEESGS
jgi:hypothetical protein